jgi:hypothetical protein
VRPYSPQSARCRTTQKPLQSSATKLARLKSSGLCGAVVAPHQRHSLVRRRSGCRTLKLRRRRRRSRCSVGSLRACRCGAFPAEAMLGCRARKALAHETSDDHPRTSGGAQGKAAREAKRVATDRAPRAMSLPMSFCSGPSDRASRPRWPSRPSFLRRGRKKEGRASPRLRIATARLGAHAKRNEATRLD